MADATNLPATQAAGAQRTADVIPDWAVKLTQQMNDLSAQVQQHTHLTEQVRDNADNKFSAHKLDLSRQFELLKAEFDEHKKQMADVCRRLDAHDTFQQQHSAHVSGTADALTKNFQALQASFDSLHARVAEAIPPKQ